MLIFVSKESEYLNRRRVSKINRIDGKLLSEMMISGANNLYNHKSEVDELNVFPVPDGDTGTNMSLTAMAMAEELMKQDIKEVTKVADKMSFATLRGARGNSGVILSQIFRGFSKSLKGKDECTTAEFAQALHDGAQAAYKAVMKPTEGTILTVARVSAEGAVEAAKSCDDLNGVMEHSTEKGAEALAQTPELLPQLKAAGVVDAGGRGWLYVLEGAFSYLTTGEIIATTSVPVPRKVKVAAQESISAEEIKHKYCTEFIIKRYSSDSDIDSFRETIAPDNDCMLVIDDEEIVKVHIHTNNPGFVLTNAVSLGELIDIKIDNMKYQHNTIMENSMKAEIKKAEPQKPQEEYGFIAVSAGKGLSQILTDLGVTKIIEGGQTMNPSTDDILKAVNKVNAKNIFVFPNNKNIIMAASQAAELAETNVVVIPTTSIPQCVTAMMSFNSKKDCAANEKALNKAMREVKSAQVTFAVRDTEYEGHKIKKGDILGIIEGKITAIGKSPETVTEKLIERMTDEDSEFITVYAGKSAKKQSSEDMVSKLEDIYDECEVSLKKGGQPLYYYIISVE